MKNITPINFFGKTFDRISISPVIADTAARTAKWTATIYTTDGAPENAIVRDCELNGAAYDAWGNDDSYILEQTALQVGFTIIPNN